MTNQELKEKLLEEFDEEFNEPIYPDATNKEPYILAETKDIHKWLSQKLDALLLSEDEVATELLRCLQLAKYTKIELITNEIDPADWRLTSGGRGIAKMIIKNQRDKLITKE